MENQEKIQTVMNMARDRIASSGCDAISCSKGGEAMEQNIKLIGSGIDTLIFNVRSCDRTGQPIKQELDVKLVQELDSLQREARRVDGTENCPLTCVCTFWMMLVHS
jgi:hypothetical protein